MKFILWVILILIILTPNLLFSQIPLYYKLKKVRGELFQNDSSIIKVEFVNRRNLAITGCKNPQIDTLLRTLTFTRISRKYLEHLITSSSQITIDVSDMIGLIFKDGKYRLIAGLTGPDNNQSKELITDSTSNLKPRNKYKKPYEVFKQNTIQIFKGSIIYYYNSSIILNKNNVFLFDFANNKRILDFSMDTIKIEPILYPDLMYENIRELYYFAGTHEIFHTTPSNIEEQLNKIDAESSAFAIERKLFKKRLAINRKKIKFYPRKRSKL